jgi:predicted phosphodiesterase
MFKEIQPLLFICGHSHIVKLEQDHKYGHWVFNPGAAGNHGFHIVKTAISFNISGNNINQIELINLGPRGR